MTVIVTGCDGMLGTAIVKMFQEKKATIISLSHKDLDITDLNRVVIKLKDLSCFHTIDALINCAAYTRVDDAESNCDEAYDINAKGPCNLAVACAQNKIPLFHISTDYVYKSKDTSEGSVIESDELDPLNEYGRTKLTGEDFVREECKNFYIIRTQWLYGPNGKNFVDTISNLINSKESIKVVKDQFGAPTYTGNLAYIIYQFVKRISEGKPYPYGIYNYSDKTFNKMSWYDFALAIYNTMSMIGALKNACQINACSSNEYPQVAARPLNTTLSLQKISNLEGIDIPESYLPGLEEYLSFKYKESK